MGRLWSIQGLPALSRHGIVETPRGADFSFLFLLTCMTCVLSWLYKEDLPVGQRKLKPLLIQGDPNSWRVPDSGHGSDQECAAQGAALPGHAQQHGALPAHCAGLLPCRCLDQWSLSMSPGQPHKLYWLMYCMSSG